MIEAKKSVARKKVGVKVNRKRPPLVSWSEVLPSPPGVPVDINLTRVINNTQWVVAVTVHLAAACEKIPVGEIRTLKSVPIRHAKNPAIGYIVRLKGRSGCLVVAGNDAEEVIDVAANICPEGALALHEQYLAALDDNGQLKDDAGEDGVAPLVDKLGLRLSLAEFMKKARADLENVRFGM